MGKIGSLAELVFASSANDWRNKHRMEATKFFQEYTKGLNRTLQVLEDIGKSGDIDLVAKTEAALVELEKSVHFGKDSSVMSSLDAATVDFSVIEKGLIVVKSSDYYQKVDDSYHVKRKVNGVPVDGVHEAINSHITRLGNSMRAVGISVPEKNVLRQRQENIRRAKKLYIKLQQKALGIEAPAKDRGLGR